MRQQKCYPGQHDSENDDALKEDEHVGEVRDGREPAVAEFFGYKPFSKVEDAAKPEELAGNDQQEESEERHVNKATPHVGMYELESGPGQRQSGKDGTLVSF